MPENIPTESLDEPVSPVAMPEAANEGSYNQDPDAANEPNFEGVSTVLEVDQDSTQASLAEAALEFAASDEDRAAMLAEYRRDGVLPNPANEAEFEVPQTPNEQSVEDAAQQEGFAAPESQEAPWYKRISVDDAKQVGKSLLGAVASAVGVKSLYDAPRYVYERIKTRGITIPGFDVAGIKVEGRTYGGGLVRSGKEIIDARQDFHEKVAGQGEPGEPTRNELHDKESALTEELARAEAALQEGEHDAEAAAAVEERRVALEIEHAQVKAEIEKTPVKDALTDFNRRLALTKEGSEKHSETRRELARLLHKNRHAETADREAVGRKIQELLDTSLEQKTTGMQASKELLNTVLVGSGARALRPLMYASMDAASFVQEARKAASREGRVLDAQFLSKQFGLKVGEFVGKLRGVDANGEKKNLGRVVMDRASAIATLAKYGMLGAAVDGDKLAGSFEVISTVTVEDIPDNFTGNLEHMANGLRNAGGALGSFFVSDAQGMEIVGAGGIEALDQGGVEHVSSDEAASVWRAAQEAANDQDTVAGKHGAMIRTLKESIYGLAGQGSDPVAQRDVWEAVQARMAAEGIPQDSVELREVDQFFNNKAALLGTESPQAAPSEQAPVEEAKSQRHEVTDKGRTIISRTVAPGFHAPTPVESSTEMTPEVRARAMLENPQSTPQIREAARRLLENMGASLDVPQAEVPAPEVVAPSVETVVPEVGPAEVVPMSEPGAASVESQVVERQYSPEERATAARWVEVLGAKGELTDEERSVLEAARNIAATEEMSTTIPTVEQVTLDRGVVSTAWSNIVAGIEKGVGEPQLIRGLTDGVYSEAARAYKDAGALEQWNVWQQMLGEGRANVPKTEGGVIAPELKKILDRVETALRVRAELQNGGPLK